MNSYTYEIALSFAREQRDYVRAVNEALKALNVKTFYDNDHAVDLWGKNHTEELPRIYAEDSHLVLMFISKQYVERRWPRHESRAILTEMTQRGTPYLLPVRFDDTPVPGLDAGWHYLTVKEFTPEKLADAVYAQLVTLGIREHHTQTVKSSGMMFEVESLASADGANPAASTTESAELAKLLSRPASQRSEDIRAALNFGTSQPVEVPRNQIVVKMKDGIRHLSESERVILQAPGLTRLAGKLAGLRFYDSDGSLSGSFVGTVEHAGLGREGSALEIRFEDALDVTVCVPFTDGMDGAVTTRLHLNGVSPENTRRCVNTVLQLHEAETAEITLDGLTLGKVGSIAANGDASYIRELRTVSEAADDLAAIQRQTGVYFPMPDEIEGHERLWMRTIRLMLDGHAAPVPRSVYRGVARADLDPAAILDEGALAIMMPGNEVTIAGHPVPLDPFYIYHPHVLFSGVSESLADVSKGVTHPRQFEVRPADESAFVAYLPNRLDPVAEVSTPWAITGVEDPPLTRLVRSDT